MFRNKTIISFISTLVFIFPLIYQPIHVVLHHGEHHEHNDGISSSEEKCLAYEYHFASFDIPEQINFIVEKIDVFDNLNSSYNYLVLDISLFHTSSRAPPIFL